MAKNVLEPAGDHVLVVDLPSEQTLSGISLPDNMRQQDMLFGTVVFVGPLAKDTTKPEDRICYGPYAGKPVVMNGIEFRLMKVGQIEAYVRSVSEG